MSTENPNYSQFQHKNDFLLGVIDLMEADDIGVVHTPQHIDLFHYVFHFCSFPPSSPPFSDEFGSKGLPSLPVNAFSHHSKVATVDKLHL